MKELDRIKYLNDEKLNFALFSENEIKTLESMVNKGLSKGDAYRYLIEEALPELHELVLMTIRLGINLNTKKSAKRYYDNIIKLKNKNLTKNQLDDIKSNNRKTKKGVENMFGKKKQNDYTKEIIDGIKDTIEGAVSFLATAQKDLERNQEKLKRAREASKYEGQDRDIELFSINTEELENNVEILKYTIEQLKKTHDTFANGEVADNLSKEASENAFIIRDAIYVIRYEICQGSLSSYKIKNLFKLIDKTVVAWKKMPINRGRYYDIKETFSLEEPKGTYYELSLEAEDRIKELDRLRRMLTIGEIRSINSVNKNYINPENKTFRSDYLKEGIKVQMDKIMDAYKKSKSPAEQQKYKIQWTKLNSALKRNEDKELKEVMNDSGIDILQMEADFSMYSSLEKLFDTLDAHRNNKDFINTAVTRIDFNIIQRMINRSATATEMKEFANTVGQLQFLSEESVRERMNAIHELENQRTFVHDVVTARDQNSQLTSDLEEPVKEEPIKLSQQQEDEFNAAYQESNDGNQDGIIIDGPETIKNPEQEVDIIIKKKKIDGDK